jgi:hypothetical protein
MTTQEQVPREASLSEEPLMPPHDPVRETAPIKIDWRFFSLEEINREDGKKHPWERDWSYGWSMMRAAA